MSNPKDFLKRHPFDLHASQIKNPLEDYARHIRALEKDEEEPELNQLFEELAYDNQTIEADIEYLTTARFLNRDIKDNGRRTYSLTSEAETYLKEFRGRTSEYIESVDETISKNIQH